MNNLRKSLGAIFYFCFTLAMLIPVAGSAAEKNMSAAEIEKLLSSNTLSGWDNEQHQIDVYYGSSGVTEGKRIRRGVHVDSGKWTVTDKDQYCQQWNRWLGKKLVCFHMYRLGDNKYRLKSDNGQYNLRVRFREGDPQGLKMN